VNRALRNRLVFSLAVLAVVLAVLSGYGDFRQAAYCNLVFPFLPPQRGIDRLLSCSNVAQRILSGLDQVEDIPASVEGWRVYRPKGDYARILVSVEKDREALVFYPRLEGEGASIFVFETPWKKRLVMLEGKERQWTPIGEQYSICLYCTDNGWARNVFPVSLEIVLDGKWTELWHKDGKIFF